MRQLKRRIADWLVAIANKLVGHPDLSNTPYYRPVDTPIPGIGHEFACAAYSYEHLKSLVEQDGPDGFGARATIKWLISEEGWKKTEEMDERELRRTLAMSGIDMDEPTTTTGGDAE